MKTSQKILITKRELFLVLTITILFGACQKDDTFFNQVPKDEEIKEEVVDTLSDEESPNKLEIESHKVSQKPQRGTSKDTESKCNEEDIIVCQIIVEVFREEDITPLENRYNSKKLSLVKPLFSNSIFLFQAEMSVNDDLDYFLAQLLKDDLVKELELNKKIKRRNQ